MYVTINNCPDYKFEVIYRFQNDSDDPYNRLLFLAITKELAIDEDNFPNFVSFEFLSAEYKQHVLNHFDIFKDLDNIDNFKYGLVYKQECTEVKASDLERVTYELKREIK